MQWSDILMILACVVFIGVILRSMFSQWRGVDSGVALKGKYHAAREWLEGNGYRIIRIREQAEWVGYYNEKAYRKQLVADFIVRQGPKTYAVKILSARDEQVNAQRMRDFWYLFFTAFGVNGVLHIDVNEERASLIDFDVQSPRYLLWKRITNRSLWFLAGMVFTFILIHKH